MIIQHLETSYSRFELNVDCETVKHIPHRKHRCRATCDSPLFDTLWDAKIAKPLKGLNWESDAVAVHSASTILAYLSAQPRVGLYGYIGLSEPSCVGCDQLFQRFNTCASRPLWAIGSTNSLLRFTNASLEHWKQLRRGLESNTDGDTETTLNQTSNVSEASSPHSLPLPIRTRATNGHVSSPWVVPTLHGDDGDTLPLLKECLGNLLGEQFRRHTGPRHIINEPRDGDPERGELVGVVRSRSHDSRAAFHDMFPLQSAQMDLERELDMLRKASSWQPPHSRF